MEILYEESFLKDLSNLKDKKVKTKLRSIIEDIKKAENQKCIRNLVRLQDHKTYYRIRIGNYRLGIEIIDNKIILVRMLHRKDIYKYFP